MKPNQLQKFISTILKLQVKIIALKNHITWS